MNNSTFNADAPKTRAHPDAGNLLFPAAEAVLRGLDRHAVRLGLNPAKRALVKASLDGARVSEAACLASLSAETAAARDRALADYHALRFILQARAACQSAADGGTPAGVPAAAGERAAWLGEYAAGIRARLAQASAPFLQAAAQQAESLRQDLVEALARYDTARARRQEWSRAKDRALTSLGRRLYAVVLELETVLPHNDARWEEFGLAYPSIHPCIRPTRVSAIRRDHALEAEVRTAYEPRQVWEQPFPEPAIDSVDFPRQNSPLELAKAV